MRVIGIDPGTYNMGVGVVDWRDDALSLVHFEVVSPPKTAPVPQRLHDIYMRLVDVVEKWRPEAMAIEQPFAGRNIRSAMAIGHAQAAAMMVGARFGLQVATYAPSQIKQAVTDYGASSKEQVQAMVAVLLGMDSEIVPPDAADALAAAICHLGAERATTLTAL